MKVRITLTEEMLGMSSANPDVHLEHTAKKSADADKIAEEMAAMTAQENLDKQRTVFPRTENGIPFLWDYQIKGFFKDQFKILLELGDGAKIGTAKLSKWTSNGMVSNHVHVTPRKIVLNLPMGPDCTRTLRADTPQGPRTCLATSETVPAGTVFTFNVSVDHPALMEWVVKSLNRTEIKGFGQWRNSGKGRAIWEEVKE
jgi:hypothetical protein